MWCRRLYGRRSRIGRLVLRWWALLGKVVVLSWLRWCRVAIVVKRLIRRRLRRGICVRRGSWLLLLRLLPLLLLRLRTICLILLLLVALAGALRVLVVLIVLVAL